MWFWIRNITLLVVLGGLAYAILTKPDFLIRKDSANVAAEGFSEFYGKIRGSIADGARELSEFKLALPDTSDRLTPQLVQRSKVVVPGDKNWRGLVTDRRFREGDTVKTKLTEFARAEGAAFINGTGTNQPKGFLGATMSTAGDNTRAFGSLQFVGSGKKVAAEIIRWIDEGAADGFILGFPVISEGLDDFITHVLPELEAQGRYERSLPGNTLRDHLGLPRKASRHAQPALAPEQRQVA